LGVLILFLQILEVYPFFERNSSNKNIKTLGRIFRSDLNNASIKNSNNIDENFLRNPERDASTSGHTIRRRLQNKTIETVRDEATTNTKFADLFANTASVETLTYWAKSGLQLPYIAELKTFWLGATKTPFKLRLRSPDPYLDNTDPAEPADSFSDIHP
jgi:hypothetical protein